MARSFPIIRRKREKQTIDLKNKTFHRPGIEASVTRMEFSTFPRHRTSGVRSTKSSTTAEVLSQFSQDVFHLILFLRESLFVRISFSKNSQLLVAR
jgi:hypothetical protein